MLENVNLVIAFTAGLLSFFSPCILPLIPSYLSFMGGISYKELVENKRKIGLLINSLFFVLGFTILFVILGVSFSGFGSLFSGASKVINIVAGSIVILLGFNFIFNFITILNVEKKFHLKKNSGSLFGSLLLGMAFGAGWTPCIGPILSTILFLAGSEAEVARGAVLLSVYSLGLGIPFILVGLFFGALQKQLARIKSKMRVISIASGIFLILIGLLLLSGNLATINAFFAKQAYLINDWHQADPSLSNLLSNLIFLTLTLLGAGWYLIRLQKKRQTPEVSFLSRLAPVRLFFILGLMSLTILSFSGVLNLFTMLSSWFIFQGL